VSSPIDEIDRLLGPAADVVRPLRATRPGVVTHAAAQVAAAPTGGARLGVPTPALGGNVVGDALHRRLSGVCTDLTGRVLPECGHIVPLDAPSALLDNARPYLERR
jgi:hypothetical protein